MEVGLALGRRSEGNEEISDASDALFGEELQAGMQEREDRERGRPTDSE